MPHTPARLRPLLAGALVAGVIAPLGILPAAQAAPQTASQATDQTATAAADTQAPGITSITRTTEKTVQEGGQVRLEWATEDSAIDRIEVNYANAAAGHYAPVTVYGTGDVVLSPTDAAYQNGDYEVRSITIYDTAGNYTLYYPDGRAVTGPSGAVPAPATTIDFTQLTFTYQASTARSEAPGLTSITRTTPQTVGKDEQVRLAWTTGDPQLDYIQVDYFSDTYHHDSATVYGSGDLVFNPTAGNYRDGTYRVQYVILRDKDGNQTTYYPDGRVITGPSGSIPAAPAAIDFEQLSFTYLASLQDVTPHRATFADRDGTEADTYAVPATTGVEYLVDGAVKPAGTYPAAGTVTVTARATTGYRLAAGATTSWTREFGIGEATYTAPATPPFADVATDHDFYTEISWLAERGISTGWSGPEGTRIFGPYRPVLRDQMAAFLYRSAGSPAYTAPDVSPFADVPTDHVFYKEISWLAETGISTGWSGENGTRIFGPYRPVLRDQMAAFLYRSAGKPAFTVPDVSPFADVPTEHVFYKEISWLADAAVSNGWSGENGTRNFGSYHSVLRDQMAAFLYRADGLI